MDSRFYLNIDRKYSPGGDPEGIWFEYYLPKGASGKSPAFAKYELCVEFLKELIGESYPSEGINVSSKHDCDMLMLGLMLHGIYGKIMIPDFGL